MVRYISYLLEIVFCESGAAIYFAQFAIGRPASVYQLTDMIVDTDQFVKFLSMYKKLTIIKH